MSENWSDLHVVVSGGTGALGTAVCGRLLAAGATCHIPCFDDRELESFELATHPRVKIQRDIDLGDEASVEAFYGSLPELWASIHCAGGFAMAAFETVSLEDYQRQMRLNATTCFLCCREATKRIRRSGRGGRLVNVAARPALEPRGGSGMVVYTMAKAAVAALTAALGEELAGDGIWVNAVAPSILDTPANRDAMPDTDPHPWPAVEDVAETLVFLASPANRSTRSGIVPVYGAS